MKNLLEEAKKLEITVDDDIKQEDLQKLIDDKKEENQNDVTFLKKELDSWKADAKKAAKKRDTFKEDRERLSKQIADLKESTKNMVSAEDLAEAKKEMKALKDFKKEVDKKTEDKKLADATDAERLQLQLDKKDEEFQKMLDEKLNPILETNKTLQKQLDETKAITEKLRFNGLKAEIVTEAARHDVFSTDQVFSIVKDKFKFHKDLGRYTHQKRDNDGKLIDEQTVNEFIKDFLTSEENENLIKSKINKDALHSDKTNKNKNKSLGGKYNPKDPDIIKEAENVNMSPERYIKVVLGAKDRHAAKNKSDKD